ncbi:MAG: alkaline phosphatase family protein [bacterium]
MAKIKYTSWRELLISWLLGMTGWALFGYFIGLRIINWNPDLAYGASNVFFLLLHSVYLYAIPGFFVGLGIWVVLVLASRLSRKSFIGKTFVAPWLLIYTICMTLLMAFILITRQDVRSGNFDNLIVVIFYLSTLLLSFLLYQSVKNRSESLTPRRQMLTLPKFFVILTVFLIFSLGFTLLTISSTPQSVKLGNEAEIRAALDTSIPTTRVAIIGWDGAEWSVINELLAKGDMPNLKKLIDSGVSAPFRSLPELKSPLIWTSIATGKVPEKHGIQDFGCFQFPGMLNSFTDYPDGIGFYGLISRFMSQADLPVSSSVRRSEAIWNILSRAEIPVGIVGWWASWPAETVKGFVLSDRFTYTLFNPRASALSLKEGQTHPPDLINEVGGFCRLPETITDAEYARFLPLASATVQHPADWSTGEYKDWNPMYQFKLAYTASESFRKAGLYLYRQFQPSFYGIYFEGIDMISHFFWQYYRPHEFPSVPAADVANFGNVIPEFYRYMDEILGDFLDTLVEGTDVLVLSDHGFGPDPNPRIPFRTGDHRTHGVFVAAGPHFVQGMKLEEVNVLDITPTILYLYGLPTGKDMDGRVVTEAIQPQYLEANAPNAIASYEIGRRASAITRSQADEHVKEQIRALGYTK